MANIKNVKALAVVAMAAALSGNALIASEALGQSLSNFKMSQEIKEQMILVGKCDTCNGRSGSRMTIHARKA